MLSIGDHVLLNGLGTLLRTGIGNSGIEKVRNSLHLPCAFMRRGLHLRLSSADQFLTERLQLCRRCLVPLGRILRRLSRQVTMSCQRGHLSHRRSECPLGDPRANCLVPTPSREYRGRMSPRGREGSAPAGLLVEICRSRYAAQGVLAKVR